MNKEIFLRDLRRFLADLPEDEREQALKYYEDYFEDAGPENEQQVIQELGSPIDIAKQIKSVNQDNIAYGQGNDFHRNGAYPNTPNHASGNSYSQNSGYKNGYTAQYQNRKKGWTQEPSKVALVIILAVLAIPVGLPLLSAAFGILVSIFAIIFSFIIVFFVLGGGLAAAGVFSLLGSLFVAGNFANGILAIGIGLVLISIGILIFWLGIVICCKLFPAIIHVTGRCFHSIGRGVQNFFN